ncbi:MAG: zinc transport system substrate-binding protein [Parasphingorhabdus sp.]|jgi:zinc transport system substrate-binding protein
MLLKNLVFRAVIGFLLLFSAKATLAVPRVVVSILPIHAIVSAIGQDVFEPELLLPANYSPHQYQLKPSDLRKLKTSDLLFWIGPQLEEFLLRPLTNLSDGPELISMMELEGLQTLKQRSNQLESDHGHSGQDPHIWLSINNAIVMAREISTQLSRVDASNSAIYASNLSRFETRLEKMSRAINADLSEVKGKSFITYHDAFQYFEKEYGLQSSGVVISSEDVSPGASTIAELRNKIAMGTVSCVFYEPQYSRKIVVTLVEGSSVEAVLIDSMGVGVLPGAQAYYQLLQQVAAGFSSCLNNSTVQ